MGRRVLVTGADTFWGGRVVQSLEADPATDVIVGMGRTDPPLAFERAEFVRADQTYSLLSRIVRATQVDTIVHTFLAVDSSRLTSRALHEVNVIGTMNLLAAAGAPDSPVRHVVMKSSTVVYGSSSHDPASFREETPRPVPARTRLERSLLEAESLVRDFAEDNPSTRVTVLRFANVLGTDIVTPISKNLSRPFFPCLFGFDPLVQFVEQDDVVRALAYVIHHQVPGLYNVAGPGRLPWSEVASICGTRPLFLSPWWPATALAPLVRLGIYEMPPELVSLLRYGRGVDGRRFSETGFEYRFTSAGAVRNFIESLRLRRVVGAPEGSYVYEHDVEQFFRHSPAVVRQVET